MEDLGPLLAACLEAFGTGRHLVGAGFVITILVSLAGRFKLLEFVPEGGRKWVAMALGLLSSLGGGIAAGASWTEIVSAAVVSGAAAIGLHEVAKKPSP